MIFTLTDSPPLKKVVWFPEACLSSEEESEVYEESGEEGGQSVTEPVVGAEEESDSLIRLITVSGVQLKRITEVNESRRGILFFIHSIKA
jgi:hypothetical protein